MEFLKIPRNLGIVSLYSRDATMFGYNNDIDQLGRALQEKWKILIK